MLKTFTTSRRDYIVVAAIVLATVAAVVIPFAWDTAASVLSLEARGLTPSTNPIDTTSAPVVFAATACILLLATSGLLLTLPRAAARRIAIIGAGAETVILLVLGAASVVAAYSSPNSDALGVLALLVISSPLFAGGIAFLAVTLLIRSQRARWRIAAAIVDSLLAWMIALLALHAASNASMPFWAGTARNPIYNPAPNGTWPLVEAGLLALVVLAGTMAVVVTAVRAREPAAGSAQRQIP
jgi:hypothetical protein